MEQKTIAGIFLHSTRQFNEKPAYLHKTSGQWQTISYSEVLKHVKYITYGLWNLGLKRGDHISLLSENRFEWPMADYAITCVGMVTTTVYPTLVPHQIYYIVEHSESKAIFVSSSEQAKKIIEIKEQLPNLQAMIVFDGRSELPAEKWIIGLDELETAGMQFEQIATCHFEDEAGKTQPEDLLTLIYTSGTTGEPKGVMLTHGNLVSNIYNTLEVFDLSDKDRFLSFLPLSHSLERMAGNFLSFTIGASVAYAENIDKVAENLKEVQPTVVISVPRLFEKMFNKVLDGINHGSSVKKSIFKWAVNVGSKVSSKFRQNGLEPSGFLGIKYRIAARLVFSKLKEAVGGHIRFFISGGAPLAKEIGEFFDAAGLAILEGFGLTETSPVTNVNPLTHYKFGTVGPVLKDVSVKLNEIGEILVKGPNVMKGYFKNDEATQEAIDNDGWFHTGDIGEIDTDGYLKITDRMKNIIVTSGGKNIAPGPLEQKFTQSPLIEQVVVIGDRRNFLTALIVPNKGKLEQLAAEKQIAYNSLNELVNHFEIINHYDEEIKSIQSDFARYEQIKKFTLLPDEFTIESGDLTPSLKIKRKLVEERYTDTISKMYH